MFGWNYKPTPIETYRNLAYRLCVAGIGSSDFHLADFGFGRLLRLSPLRSSFCRERVHVYRANSIRILFVFYYFFSRRDPFSIGITFYIHHFFIYTFKSTTPFIHKYGLQMAWSQIHKVVSINLDFQIFETTLCWNPMYAFLANCLQLMCVSCGFFFTSQTCIMCFTHATYSVIPFRH